MTPFSCQKRFPKKTSIFYRFWSCFASPWAAFGLPFGSLWLPLGSLLAPFGTLWLPLGSLGAVFGPPKHLIASGLKWYILFGSLWLPLGSLLAPLGFLLAPFGRSCRDSAENVPRTLQEPAENPPYEPQTKLPFTVRLLRKDFVRRQTLRQNRLE